jgi:hypothetical protein
LGRHAVSDSTRFFETPETSDYTFGSGVEGASGSVSFPSAMQTRVSREQHGARAVFRGESSSRRSAQDAREGGRRAVLVLPQWNAGPDGHVGLCRLLNRFGMSALRLTLPYHDARRPPN